MGRNNLSKRKSNKYGGNTKVKSILNRSNITETSPDKIKEECRKTIRRKLKSHGGILA